MLIYFGNKDARAQDRFGATLVYDENAVHVFLCVLCSSVKKKKNRKFEKFSLF